jgi:hypothetical protein
MREREQYQIKMRFKRVLLHKKKQNLLLL